MIGMAVVLVWSFKNNETCKVLSIGRKTAHWKGMIFMQQMYIKFNDAEQVRKFINMIDRLEGKFELGSGERIVNPKSIIGILTLDLAQPQELRCYSDNLKLMDVIRPFCIV